MQALKIADEIIASRRLKREALKKLKDAGGYLNLVSMRRLQEIC